MSAEVRHIGHLVGVDNAHHTHAVKIKSLREHLRTDKDVGFACLELADDLFVRRPRTCGVEVHTRGAGIGKYGLYFRLYFLRAVTYVAQVRLMTVRTRAWHVVTLPTIVTDQALLALMIRERHITLGALGSPSTVVAIKYGTVTATV